MKHTPDDVPWVDLRDLAPQFGVTCESAKNKVWLGTFEARTYKPGKRIVADNAVVEAFFAARRDEGLRQLNDSTGS